MEFFDTYNLLYLLYYRDTCSVSTMTTSVIIGSVRRRKRTAILQPLDVTIGYSGTACLLYRLHNDDV